MRHIDEFIDDPKTDKKIAAWFESHRRPAIEQLKNPNPTKLFATYKGKRYRVTGCSRFGDVWLAEDFNRDVGYDLRVCVDDCSEWALQD